MLFTFVLLAITPYAGLEHNRAVLSKNESTYHTYFFLVEMQEKHIRLF